MADNNNNRFWPRCIALVDMNAFFASIEQAEDPALWGKPVAITNGLVGTCIITSTYEARAYGVHTGMRIKQARQLCPGLIQRPARPERYAEISTHIMDALQGITPDVEVFSVDEAFLDLTRCQDLWQTKELLGLRIKEKVYRASGLKCSVGISGDKTTAKFAAKLKKPDGLTIIPPWETALRLRDVPATELCGINKGIGAFLARHGAVTCGEVARLPISVLGRRFGNPGRRIWHMCQGTDPDKVETNIRAPKSVGHGKVVPPDSRDRETLYMYLIHMAEKVATRLRQNALDAQLYSVGLRTLDSWVGDKFRTPCPTNDSKPIVKMCKLVMRDYWQGEGIFQVHVGALDPRPERGQYDLFGIDDSKAYKLNKAMDLINRKFGEFTLAPANLLDKSTMPNVIAPAWKPYGHRQTIPNSGRRRDRAIVKKIYEID